MKNKVFRTEEGQMWYTHYTGTDFFDNELFPRRDGREWKEIMGTSGQNAERKAKSKATTIFNYMMKLIIDEMIDRSSFILFGIFGMGYLARSVRESDDLSPETFNKKAVIAVVLSEEFKKKMPRWFKARLTKRGRIKLYQSVKIRK